MIIQVIVRKEISICIVSNVKGERSKPKNSKPPNTFNPSCLNLQLYEFINMIDSEPTRVGGKPVVKPGISQAKMNLLAKELNSLSNLNLSPEEEEQCRNRFSTDKERIEAQERLRKAKLTAEGNNNDITF